MTTTTNTRECDIAGLDKMELLKALYRHAQIAERYRRLSVDKLLRIDVPALTNDEAAALLKHSPASISVNREWAEGIASSIRDGVAHIPTTSDGVLLMLADQAAVTTEDLRRLAGAWRRNPTAIVAAQYAGTLGVPAIFPRWCFRELNELRGDRGAQSLLQRHTDRVVRLAMPSAELDIDRPEDLLTLEVGTQIKRQKLADS